VRNNREVGVARSAAWILASVDMPDNAMSRLVLWALIPEKVKARTKQPTKRLATFLRRSEFEGQLDRGEVFVRPTDKAALLHLATHELGPWTPADFIDAEQARREVGELIRGEPTTRQSVNRIAADLLTRRPTATELKARLAAELDALDWWATY
jgi:hypothetical protein